jgi:8-amino-7-oxononanoate synthase
MTLSPPAGAEAGRPPTSRRPWLDRWLASNADLAELHASNPQMDAVIEEIDGRRVRIGDRWLIDFASCNYLGFDLDREIIEAIPAYLDPGAPTRAGRA